MKTSKLEEHIIILLQTAKIKFEREKTYPDLKSGFYRFDFYIPALNTLIEVDGSQHFEYNKKFYKTRAEWLKAKERDRRKNSYALAHKIPLYRIPYTEVEKLTCAADIFQKKFLVTSKWYNDVLKL